MALTVDVVIPVSNHWALTESCLRHLAAQTLAHRVIVGDNGSTDGTPEHLARRLAATSACCAPRRRSRSRSCATRGAAAGDGDVIVLLNNDVDCEPDFLERLIAPFERDPADRRCRLALHPPERPRDRLGRDHVRRDAERVRAAGGATGRGGRLADARPGGRGRHRRGLPPHGLGAGRRPRRGVPGLPGGLRARAAAARGRLGDDRGARRALHPPRLRELRRAQRPQPLQRRLRPRLRPAPLRRTDAAARR